MRIDTSKLKPLELRRAIMANSRTNVIQADAATLPLVGGTLVSPTQTMRPISSGLQLYAVLFVTAKVKNNAATAATRCDMAGANLVQGFTHFDADGLQGHQCNGRDLEIINIRRQSGVIGAADALSTTYGLNFPAQKSDNMPLTIAAGATVDIRHSFVIPFAYGGNDFRGAKAATQSNSAQNFLVRFPTKAEAFVDSAANDFGAIYKATAGNLEFTEFKYSLLMFAKTIGFTLEDLPYEDMAYNYIIQSFSRGGVTQNSDTRIPLDSGRVIMSSYIAVDNGGVTYQGDDVNYTTIYGAGTQDLQHMTPDQHEWQTSLNTGVVLPKGYYLWNHTAKPVDVAQWGGQVDLAVNMKTVNNNCTIYGANDYFTFGGY